MCVKNSDQPFDCPDCNISCELSPYSMDGTLYTEFTAFRIKIRNRFCPHCDKQWQYEGTNCKMYNVNNKDVYTHSLLNGYTSSVNKSAMAMNAYLTIIDRTFSILLAFFY